MERQAIGPNTLLITFVADGSLAKMRNVFGKFMGTIKIVKEKFYDSNGKLLHTRLKCYDLGDRRSSKKVHK